MQLKTFLKTLALIHIALCGGLMAFGVFAYYQNRAYMASTNQQDVFIYIVPIVGVASYFLSQLLFRKKLRAIAKEEKLATKLGKYQIASIYKYALLEGSGFLALIAYYLSGNALYLAVAIALIAYLFAQRPTADKMKREVPLTYEEQKQFENLT